MMEMTWSSLFILFICVCQDLALQHHSGVLGLCAFVEAFPYDVPPFVPPILMELSTHLNDAQVHASQCSGSGIRCLVDPWIRDGK
jgi:hypothetical protein